MFKVAQNVLFKASKQKYDVQIPCGDAEEIS